MIVRLQGGTGNQLFQYAFGRSVALARNEELFFEKRGDMESGGSTFPYSLDLFNTIVKFAHPGQRGSEYYEATAVTFDKEYIPPPEVHTSSGIGKLRNISIMNSFARNYPCEIR